MAYWKNQVFSHFWEDHPYIYYFWNRVRWLKLYAPLTGHRIQCEIQNLLHYMYKFVCKSHNTGKSSLNLNVFFLLGSWKVSKRIKQAGTGRLTFETCNKVFHFSIIEEQLKRGNKLINRQEWLKKLYDALLVIKTNPDIYPIHDPIYWSWYTTRSLHYYTCTGPVWSQKFRTIFFVSEGTVNGRICTTLIFLEGMVNGRNCTTFLSVAQLCRWIWEKGLLDKIRQKEDKIVKYVKYLSLMINVIKVLSYFGRRRLTLNVRHDMTWQNHMYTCTPHVTCTSKQS